jgi:hypothetical protein
MAAMGVGMNQGIAHLWVSWVTDPAGNAMLCGGGDPMAPPPPTAVPPTATPEPPTATPVPPTATQPPTSTAVPPTATVEAPTAVPPTATIEAPTAVPPTATVEAPTAVPPTATVEAPTAVPPTATTAAAPTGTVLNATGTVAAGGTGTHSFDVFPGLSYTVVVSPSAEFDAEPLYQCGTGDGRQEGSFDWGWEGEEETLNFTPTGQTRCNVIVRGYEGSTGTYTITATAR